MPLIKDAVRGDVATLHQHKQSINDAKGIHNIESLIRQKVIAPHVSTPDSTCNPLVDPSIVQVWSEMIRGVIGAGGPFSRPQNEENLESLVALAVGA